MTRRAIIVGRDGQDGQLLWARLNAQGYALAAWTRNKITGIPGTPGTDSGSICDPTRVADIVGCFLPDEIYFLAAHHHSSEDGEIDFPSLLRRSLETNTSGLVNFLEAICRCSLKTRLFYAASSHIFGSPVGGMQDESTPINPESAYGISKATGLFACRHYRRKYGLFASVGILYNHESALRTEKFLSRKIARCVARIKQGSGEKLTLGRLDAVADWGFAPDYVDAMQRILGAPQADDFVVATGQPHTVREFARIAFDCVGLDYASHVESDPDIVRRDVGVLVGNPAHLTQVTGWRPTVDFATMVRSLVAQELRQLETTSRNLSADVS